MRPPTEDEIRAGFGLRLRFARETLTDLTPSAAARAAGIGVSTYFGYEGGAHSRVPGHVETWRLARTVGVPTAYLVYGELADMPPLVARVLRRAAAHKAHALLLSPKKQVFPLP